MSYGFQVYDANGQVVLSATDRITRFITAFTVAANQDGSLVIPEFDASRGRLIAYMADPSVQWRARHSVHGQGNTVYWKNPWPYDDIAYGPTTILVLMVA